MALKILNKCMLEAAHCMVTKTPLGKRELQEIGLIMNVWLQDVMFENCSANFGNRLILRIVSHTVNQEENKKKSLKHKKKQYKDRQLS